MTNPAPNRLDFGKVEALRRHMLLSVKDICKYLGVSRETWYNWQRGCYPRPPMERKLKAHVRELLTVLTEESWPTPDVIAADPKDRLEMLLAVTKRRT